MATKYRGWRSSTVPIRFGAPALASAIQEMNGAAVREEKPGASAIAQEYRDMADEVLVSAVVPQHCSLVKLIIRKASAYWKGGTNGGSRVVTTESGTLSQASFSSRTPLRRNSDTDPAELIAAAHASSFSLALSHELGSKAVAAGEIVTAATVTTEHLTVGWTIMNIHLDVLGRLPRLTQGRFIDATLRAKTNCLVSRLLRANLSMNAKLEN